MEQRSSQGWRCRREMCLSFLVGALLLSGSLLLCAAGCKKEPPRTVEPAPEPDAAAAVLPDTAAPPDAAVDSSPPDAAQAQRTPPVTKPFVASRVAPRARLRRQRRRAYRRERRRERPVVAAIAQEPEEEPTPQATLPPPAAPTGPTEQDRQRLRDARSTVTGLAQTVGLVERELNQLSADGSRWVNPFGKPRADIRGMISSLEETIQSTENALSTQQQQLQLLRPQRSLSSDPVD